MGNLGFGQNGEQDQINEASRGQLILDWHQMMGRRIWRIFMALTSLLGLVSHLTCVNFCTYAQLFRSKRKLSPINAMPTCGT